MKLFQDYIKELQSTPIDRITEHSKRTALENLLNGVASELTSKVSILHEPKREGKFGSPDFKITNSENIIGYIENKKIDENLDKILKSDQIKKYKCLSENIIITNYIEWIWIKDGEVNKRQNLCFLSDIENKKFKLNANNVEEVKQILKNFFQQPPIGIAESKKLAEALAVRGKHLKEFVLDELKIQEKRETTGRLYGLYETFRDFVFDKLTLSEFSDAFSQMLIYGLFLAKLNADTKDINLYNAKQFIPVSNKLIKELVEFLNELDNEEYRQTKWIVEEVLTIMNNLQLSEINKSLSFKKQQKDKDNLTIKDPYVYFYEDFLAAYDYDLRKSKGVYYTPPPVVNFIIRGINDILLSVFGIKKGFADKDKVTVLDFATGTGTFLLEVLRQIIESLPSDSGKKHDLISEHILKNLYGFEYMIAPYTIAHLKLSQFLKDEGYEMQGNDKFQIYLTNTLVPMDKQQKIPMLPALSKEISDAQNVKNAPIFVITGNPPYSKKSKNTGNWITQLLKGHDTEAKHSNSPQPNYYMVDGKALGETQNWLRDDYVKFIRFAQWKMHEIENGVIGIITNHTFLDSITFRGMRQSLLNSFDQLYFLDLHGSAKREENVPAEMKNENVFDIEQGVCISFLIKKKGLEKKIFHADMWGSRVEKYLQCIDNSIDTINWEEIKPKSPYYFFIPRTNGKMENYRKWWSVSEIFKAFSLPLMSGNDNITIQFSKIDLKNNFELLVQKNISDLKNVFNFEKESTNWTIQKAKDDVIKTNEFDKKTVQICYRLFDKRYSYFTGNSSGFHSRPGSISKQMLHENIGLLLPRQISKRSFQHVFCTDLIPDMCCFSAETKGANQLFPLYLYHKNIDNTFEKEPNLTKDFMSFLYKKYAQQCSPEQILGYIYAILHSQTYREKYFEDLKIDFARIPFVKSENEFIELSDLGNKLVQAHLLKEVPDKNIGNFIGEGDSNVEKVTFNEKTNQVSINKNQYFENVSAEIFDFKIGGYQPIDKYLKSRKDRILNLDEKETVENIIKVIDFTIEIMSRIDDLTKKWI